MGTKGSLRAVTAIPWGASSACTASTWAATQSAGRVGARAPSGVARSCATRIVSATASGDAVLSPGAVAISRASDASAVTASSWLRRPPAPERKRVPGACARGIARPPPACQHPPVPTPRWSPYLAGVTCFSCARPHDPRALETVCRACGLPLRVDYHLDRIRLTPDDLAGRPASLWRYREVLPLAAGEVTLTEGWTPLLEVEANVHVKDEARNPTGSFKARGMTVAVSAAVAAGARALVAPSAGNAASALAAYGAAAGLPVTVAMPEDTPRMFFEECRHYGAEVQPVPGTIADAGRWLREHGPAGAFDVSTLKEPYRVEGKKTMAYELYEQLGQRLPDVIVYPTGGGTGLVGMWKAFQEMAALGWKVARPPRLVCVQPEGCAPVASAFQAGRPDDGRLARPPHRRLRPAGPLPHRRLSVPARPARDRRHGGDGVGSGDRLRRAGPGRPDRHRRLPRRRRRLGRHRTALRQDGWIRPGEQVVVFNTGTGLKYRP